MFKIKNLHIILAIIDAKNKLNELFTGVYIVEL